MATRPAKRSHDRPAPAEREPADVKLTVRLPGDLVKRAKHYAIDADLDVQDIVAQALAVFLAQQRAKSGQRADG